MVDGDANRFHYLSWTTGGRFALNARISIAALFVQAAVIFAGEAAANEQRAITALDLANIRDIGGSSLSAINIFGALSVSPDGDYVAFQLQTPNVQTGNYDLAWHVVEARKHGRQLKVGDGGDPILNLDKSWLVNGSRYPIKPQWSADSTWILYLKKVDGNVQLWRSKRDGSISEQITMSDADLLSFSISDDGTEISFTTAIPPEELSTQLVEEADRGFLYDERFHPDKARKPVGRMCGIDGEEEARTVGIERACEPLRWIYDIATKRVRRAPTEEIEADSQKANRELNRLKFLLTNSDRYLIGKRRDGSGILLANENVNRFSGYLPPLRLFALLEDKGYRCPANECYAHKGIIEGAWWRPGRNEIIFQRADGSNASMTGLYSWIPGVDHVRKIIKTEDQLGDCQILEDSAICLREQWTHPRTIVSVDLDSGKIDTIYDPNLEFDQIKFSKIEKVEWEDEFGNPTHAHLVYPLYYEPGRRYPLVITTYRSRGFLRGAVGDEYPIHLLSANGFMVLSHDMPRRFQRDAVTQRGLAEFKDNYERRSSLSAQKKILDSLEERGLVDPAAVAITGLSDGAMQVIFALTHTNRFSAAIASSAFDYATAYYSNNQQRRARLRHLFGSTPDDDNEGLYEALSLGLNAEQVDAPLLINVSEQELQNSVESFARLQDAGKPVEMYVFPGEYHIKWQPQHRLAIYRRNVQWLKFWLMGEEEDDPVSPGQYARWRKMREERCAWDEPDGEKPSYCEYSNAGH